MGDFVRFSFIGSPTRLWCNFALVDFFAADDDEERESHERDKQQSMADN